MHDWLVGVLGPLLCTTGHTVLMQQAVGFCVSFSTGPPGDRGALHSFWNVIATQPIRLVPAK